MQKGTEALGRYSGRLQNRKQGSEFKDGYPQPKRIDIKDRRGL